MNKKSKIKTTLDSLFTSGRIKPEELKEEVVIKTPDNKPASTDTAKKTALPVKKAPESKKEEVKPVEIIKPVENKPVQELPVESQKPVVSESISQPQKLANVGENPSAFLSKSLDPNQAGSSGENNLANKTEVDSDEHLVIFTLGKELYGVTIHSVESIIKIQAITVVPRTASYVLGVTNLRGTVVPVLDLRKRFNLQFTETTPNTRIIIVNAEGSKVGIVVDEVTEVLKVAQQSIQPPPPMSTTIESAFICGIARINDRLVILLDLEKVLASSSRQYNR